LQAGGHLADREGTEACSLHGDASMSDHKVNRDELPTHGPSCGHATTADHGHQGHAPDRRPNHAEGDGKSERVIADDVRPLSPRHWLLDDHVALLQRFEEVLAWFRQNDREATRRAWTVFESTLTAHLEAEETLIFPAFRDVDRAETEALAQDHARFRSKLDELGLAVDLHIIRADSARGLIEALTVHSRREDGRMYPWAEKHLDALSRRRLRERLALPPMTTELPREPGAER
jgi:hypothetical protein